jgi:glutathione peroxidase
MKVLLSMVALLMAATVWSAPMIYGIALNDIDGKPTSLKAYQGKVLLVVNVASKCGYTPQYAGLEKLYKEYRDRGLVVLGFPCNDFGSQEPGTEEEIKDFCETNYGVTFPLFAKLHVKGAEQHPLYAALTGKDSPFPGEIRWNFSKFLIGRDGRIVERYESKVKPDDAELVKAVERALGSGK